MRMLRHLLMIAAFAIPTLAATAQDGRVFTFTTTPGEEVVSEVKDDSIAIALRPNQSGEYYLYVKNPARADKTYTVELKGGPGSSLSSQVTVTIPGEKWKRVRLKPPAPTPAPAGTPVATPAAPDAKPAAPAEPLPPGSEIAATEKGFAFTLRLLDDKGNVVADSTSKVDVIIQKPEKYIGKPSGTINSVNRLVEVKMTVTPTTAFKDTAEVKLAFPPQPALKTGILREGIYSRTITDGKAVTLRGAIENVTDKVRVNIGIDGFDRAFIFTPDPKGNTNSGTMVQDQQPAVRVFPADKFATDAASQPVAAFPVKIEVDNDNGGTLELLVRRVGAPADETEVIKVGRTRDERMWIDVAGPTDGGFLITNRSKDWIKPIDLRSLRGKCEIVAVLKPTAGTKVESSPFKLIVDGTPPEKVEFTKLPARHYKGRPLPVNVKATDEDTAIAKAVFFIGKLTDDGKIPPEAVKFDGKQVMDKNNTATGIWTADLAFPPEKRGEVFIGVQFTDSVGLQTTQTQRIELVDAPPPSGTIEGKVIFGEVRQPKVTVKLMAEGKEKGLVVADEFGRYKFEKVPVGTYAVVAEIKDSGFGKAGTSEAVVEADKTFVANISLVKKVK